MPTVSISLPTFWLAAFEQAADQHRKAGAEKYSLQDEIRRVIKLGIVRDRELQEQQTRLDEGVENGTEGEG